MEVTFDADKKYMVVAPVGGFGNRMWGLIVAHAIAEIDKRQLWIHWITQGGAPHHRFMARLADLYTIDDAIEIDALTWKESARQESRYVDTERYDKEKNPLHVHFLGPGLQEQFVVAFLHGAQKNERGTLQQLGADIFRQRYHLIPPLAAEANHIRENEFAGRKVVGIQVRRYGHRLSRNWKPTEKISRFIEHRVKLYDNEIFFVSSDCNRYTEHLKKRFSGKIVTQDKDETHNSRRAIQQTAIDFDLCAKCDEFYGTPYSGLTAFIAALRKESPQYAEVLYVG